MVQAKQLAYHDRDRRLPIRLRPSACRLVALRKPMRRAPGSRQNARCRGTKCLPMAVCPATLCTSRPWIGGECRLAHSEPVWHLRSRVVAGDTGVMLQNRGAYYSLEPCHQPPGTWQNPDAHAHCVYGQTRRQALVRAGLHGGRRTASNSVASLCRHDRFRPRHSGDA